MTTTLGMSMCTVYKDRQEVAKVSVPDLLLLRGKMTGKLKRILNDLISEGELCTKQNSRP